MAQKSRGADTARMDANRRWELVDRYREGPDAVAEALEGITDEQLDRRPGPGDWTPREVVHHLVDSEMTSAIRLRRLLAEDAPIIVGYDEEEFARRLFYADRPIEASLEAFRASRRTTSEILDRLTDEQWHRSGTHTESGPYGVETWLEIYANHAHDHADQIRRPRA
jgi:DinB family protein